MLNDEVYKSFFSLRGAVVSALRALLHPPRLLYCKLHIVHIAFVFWTAVSIKWREVNVVHCEKLSANYAFVYDVPG